MFPALFCRSSKRRMRREEKNAVECNGLDLAWLGRGISIVWLE